MYSFFMTQGMSHEKESIVKLSYPLRAVTPSSGICTVGKFTSTQHTPLFVLLVNHRAWHLGWLYSINIKYQHTLHEEVRQDLPPIIATLIRSSFEYDCLPTSRKMLARQSVSLWPFHSIHCPLTWFLFSVSLTHCPLVFEVRWCHLCPACFPGQTSKFQGLTVCTHTTL